MVLRNFQEEEVSRDFAFVFAGARTSHIFTFAPQRPNQSSLLKRVPPLNSHSCIPNILLACLHGPNIPFKPFCS